MNSNQLTRRDFLKITGVGALIAVPSITGYAIYRSALGESLPSFSPYLSSELKSDPSEELDGSKSILLLHNQRSDNPLGVYIDEILRAEGLTGFHAADVSSVDESLLERYEILILAEGPLNTEQVEMLESYVSRGGRLIAMRPDKKLAPILGLEAASGSLADGYIKVVPDQPVSAGINTSTMQFHGSTDLYTLAGADVIAWLYKDRGTFTEYPALTVNPFGNGLAAMWAFDLGRSVALTRQGNPEFANQDRDGLDGVRTVDMFVDWIDLDRISIPQADEQQRLLANLLTFLSQGKSPLPRIWYFPTDNSCILITTGDSHMNPAPFIEDVLGRVDKHGGSMSVYYSPEIVGDLGRAMRRSRFFLTDHITGIGSLLGDKFTSPTPVVVADWRKRGHEFALHPYVETTLEEGWEKYWKEFTGRGYGPVPPSVRTHRILWTGWVESARVQAGYGIRMNMDFYHVGPSMQNQAGEWVYGHLTGSGRPMKFIDENGHILNIYQQLTQLADEHLIPMDVPGWGGWPNLSPAEAVEVSEYLFDRSVNHGDYCAIGGQFHIDPFQVGGEAAEKAAYFLEGTLQLAADLGIPIWSAQDWLKFTEARAGTEISKLAWDGSTRRMLFDISVPGNNEFDITVMIPLRHDECYLDAILVDGNQSSYQTRDVGGIEYACTAVEAITHNIIAVYR